MIDPMAVLVVWFFFVAIYLAFLVVSLLRQWQKKDWGWFILTIIFSPLALMIYWILVITGNKK